MQFQEQCNPIQLKQNQIDTGIVIDLFAKMMYIFDNQALQCSSTSGHYHVQNYDQQF